MTIFDLTIAYLIAARLIELLLAQSNTRRLLAAGAVEHGKGLYPTIVALHALWIAGLLRSVGSFSALSPANCFRQ